MLDEQRAGGLCRAAHSGLCGSNNKRMCVCGKKSGRKGAEERRRERFKADQYFIFERRCHDGNRYLKIEKHDSTSRFELKRAGGGWERRERERESARKGEESSSKSGEAEGGRVPQRLVVTQV